MNPQDLPLVQQIENAAEVLIGVTRNTPLELSKRLSEKYGARIYIKREDLQEVRSFKIRGAYNVISSLTPEEKKRGVVCASAGNHAQGVSYSANKLKIKATIFMPAITPLQKIQRVKHFGKQWIEVKLVGQTYDESSLAAKAFCLEKNAVFVHPFDDPRTIAGQGTIGKEIYSALEKKPDFILSPEGGGGLIAGIAIYAKDKDKKVKVIGVEPSGAASMYESLRQNKVVSLSTIDTFVDGAAVQTAGNLTFQICKEYVDKILTVPEGKVCTTMIELYQNEGIIAEPAGALAISALDEIAKEIKGKTVVCILSGGNNDILRYPEIMERSLVYQGRKHYFIVEFTQKPGELRSFVNKALGPTDDIVLFEYIKKTNKEKGPALIGVELKDKRYYEPLIKRMDKIGLNYTILKSDNKLYRFLV